MSKEARDFIYGTDLIDQHDYHDNDCGEGFLIPPSHLATILEAYHQERNKEALNHYESELQRASKIIELLLKQTDRQLEMIMNLAADKYNADGN